MKKIYLVILILILTGCSNKNEETLISNKVNLNEYVIEDKQIDSLITSNTSVIYDNGITTFKTTLTNNGDDIFIDNLNVKFLNKNNTEIIILKGELKKTLKNSEKTQITIISDIDLTDAYKIEYHID